MFHIFIYISKKNKGNITYLIQFNLKNYLKSFGL